MATTVCKGKCQQLKISVSGRLSPYKEGLKKCSICCVYLKHDGNRCPCCNNLLKVGTRNRLLKKKDVFRY